MTAQHAATAAHEDPVLFPAGQDILFGILTHPTDSPLGAAVVAIWGGGNVASTGRNRIWVRLCRHLAAKGFHTFRFDFHGVGESTGEAGRFLLHEPFVEDLEGAIRWLEQEGIHRFILVGWCFGARTALAVADKVPGLQAVVLVSIPLRDNVGARATLHVGMWRMIRAGLHPWIIRQLFDRDRRRFYAKVLRKKWNSITARRDRRTGFETDRLSSVNSVVLNALEGLTERSIPVLLLFGTEDQEYDDFEIARSGGLADTLADNEGACEVISVTGRLHDVGQVRLQDASLDAIEGWIARVAIARQPDVS